MRFSRPLVVRWQDWPRRDHYKHFIKGRKRLMLKMPDKAYLRIYPATSWDQSKNRLFTTLVIKLPNHYDAMIFK